MFAKHKAAGNLLRASLLPALPGPYSLCRFLDWISLGIPSSALTHQGEGPDWRSVLLPCSGIYLPIVLLFPQWADPSDSISTVHYDSFEPYEDRSRAVLLWTPQVSQIPQCAATPLGAAYPPRQTQLVSAAAPISLRLIPLYHMAARDKSQKRAASVTKSCHFLRFYNLPSSICICRQR